MPANASQYRRARPVSGWGRSCVERSSRSNSGGWFLCRRVSLDHSRDERIGALMGVLTETLAGLQSAMRLRRIPSVRSRD